MTITDHKIKMPWETPRKVFSPPDVVAVRSATGSLVRVGSWVVVLIGWEHPFR